jgi:peroxiredoxin
MIKPRQPVPALDVPLAAGGRWTIADQHPDRFTLVVFYRGVHCQVCREYISELDGLIGDFADAGVTSVLAVSGDDEGRAHRAVEEWKLSRVPVGYAHSLASMREWGLYVSKAIKEGQPNEFGEPGLFLIRPDGTLYASVLGTMPFMRPRLKDVLETVRWVNDKDYPARGEV